MKTWILNWWKLSTLRNTHAELIRILFDRSFALSDFTEYFIIERFYIFYKQTNKHHEKFDWESMFFFETISIKSSSNNLLLQCNTIFIWIMWIVQINFEMNWRYHDSNNANERNEWSNTWWIRSISMHTSFEIIINHKKISIIEIDVYLFKNWLMNFYEIQISYINRQNVSNRFIVCEMIVRSIFISNFENVKHSFSKMLTYNIVRIVKRLIIV